MTLDTVVQTLRNQATANNSIVLNTDILPQAEVDQIRTAFLLGTDQFLTITNIKVSDIPDPQAGTLQVSAGTAALLKQDNIVPKLTFSVDQSGAIQYLIAAPMGQSWKFTDSFPNLTISPFNQVTVSDTCFVYSSIAQESYLPWAEKPTEAISLAAGLNFASWMTLNIFGGAVALLEQILDATTAYKFSGPFSPDDVNPYPVTTLTLELSAKNLKLTDQLTIGSPSLVIEVTEPVGSIQNVDLRLTASTEDLQFSVGICGNDPALTFGAQPKTGHEFTADKILTLPGGSGFQSFIPDELVTAFSDCALNNFSITLTGLNTVGYVNLSIGTKPGFTWPLIPTVLTLENMFLDLSFFDPSGPDSSTMVSVGATCELFPSVFPGTFEFDLEMDNSGTDNKWEITDITGNYYGTVQLSDLVSAIAGAGTSVPNALSDFTFSDFGINVTKLGNGYTYSLHGRCDAAFPILDTELVSSLVVVADYSQTGYDIDLQGLLRIGEEDFALELKLASAQGAALTGTLSASWTVNGTEYLEFSDIAQAFGFSDDDIPTIPPGLDLSLKSASLTYDFGKKELGIGFESANWGDAVFAAMQNPANQNKWQFFFGLAIGKPISLTNLPLVQKFLPADDSIEINDIQVVLSSYQISGTLADSINALIATLGSSYPQAPNTDNNGMPAGVNFSLNVDFGSIQLPIVLGTGPSTAANQTAPPASPLTAMATTALTQPAASPPPSPPSSQGSVKWFTVGKSFGPVSFQRVGVQYQDSKLFFLLDASLGFSTLTLGLDGLGVGSPLTSFEPEVHISGVSISFVSPPVTIEGGFLVVPPPLPDGVTEEYMGEVVIAIDPYLISGVGAYAKKNGEPSVFVFAQVKGEFGGPPAFFITGFMGGFGYNSQLTLPAADQVSTFPFIAGLDDPTIFGSATPTPMQVLTALSGVVTPTTGESWIAAGIMFRSFELVLGRALLVVSFGKDFEVALLGLASMSLPQGATTDAYAYVELQLEAVFKPNEGSFSIVASLTNNSFLLTRDCHLTGGFAFCLWFGPNQYAGDFVVTVGGYHPAFLVPSWYPQVAPVGFNWNVGGGVTVKGGAYFALTPTAAMAGGSLEVLYHSGDLKAWFTAWANVMIRWKPFYFTAGIGISIGASYRLNLLLTSVTVSVELGASLDLWGPPTGGIVHVHWSIISFSVSFGADPIDPDAMTLDWEGFQSLLPNNPPPPSSQASAPAMRETMAVAPAPPADPTTILLTVNVNRGLSRQDSTGTWIVRADELVFTTHGAIPASALQLVWADPNNPTGPLVSQTLPLPKGAPATINIRPMQQTGVTSTHSVKLTFVDEKEDIVLSKWPTPVTQTANLPEALWGAPIDDKSTPAPAAATIPGLPTGVSLTAPPARAGAAIGPVDPAKLVDLLGGGFMPLTPATQTDPIPAPVVDTNSITEIISSLASPTSIHFQQNLVTALTGFSAAPPTSSPLTQLAQQAGSLFSQAPLRTAGSQ